MTSRSCAYCGSGEVRTKVGKPLCDPCRQMTYGGRPITTNWREPLEEPIRTLANPYGSDPGGVHVVRPRKR